MSTNTAQVLVIDDEPAIRELLTDALRIDGVGVRSAGSAAEAFALAEQSRPDMLVTDIRLPDRDGLDVIDQLRRDMGEMPAVVMSGWADASTASEAVRRGCADFLTKPLDLKRLRQTVQRELGRRGTSRQMSDKVQRYRELVHRLNASRRDVRRQLLQTCSSLTRAYSQLNRQLVRHEALLRFQRFLLGCTCDDDVFKGFFQLLAERGGGLFGIALVCDSHARLQIIGRFGTPGPDGLEVCRLLADGLTPTALENPQVLRFTAATHQYLIPAALQPSLAGASFLCVPLLPSEGNLIGLGILYRRGEQPFTDEELALAEMLAPSMALAVQRCAAPSEE